MRNNAWVFMGVLLAVGASFISTGSGEEPVKEYYENGQLKTEQSLKDGKLEGPFKVYFESGPLRKEGAFKNGKREGTFKTYGENGQRVLEESYKSGKLDGAFKTYYGNGKRENAFNCGELHRRLHRSFDHRRGRLIGLLCWLCYFLFQRNKNQ